MRRKLKYVLIGFLFPFANISFAQQNHRADSAIFHHCFFPKNSVMIGLAAPYAAGINAVGINMRSYYNINKRICFGPEFSYFKNGDLVLLDANLVVHYIFETRWVGIYPVVGINFSSKREFEVKSEFGTIWGAGIHRNFRRLTLFAEYSSVEGELDEHIYTSSLLYNLR